MIDTNIIGGISVIIFLIFLFYSTNVSLKFFRQYQNKNELILKFVIKHIVTILIFCIIVFLVYRNDMNIFFEYIVTYISFNIILFDIYYLIARINDKKFRNMIRKEKIKWTVIIVFISSFILGIISSIKYESTLYGTPYIFIAIIFTLIDFILLIKENREKNNN